MGDAPRLIRNQWLPLAPILSNRLSPMSCRSMAATCITIRLAFQRNQFDMEKLLEQAAFWEPSRTSGVTFFLKKNFFPPQIPRIYNFHGSFNRLTASKSRIPRKIRCSKASKRAEYLLERICSSRFSESLLVEPFFNPNRTVKKPCRRFSAPERS